MLVRRTKRLLRKIGVLPPLHRPAADPLRAPEASAVPAPPPEPSPAPAPPPKAPAPAKSRGPYVVTAELKAKLHALGVDTFLPPDARVLPFDSVFEPPCSIKWMDVLGRISIGSFSYGVSGHFNNVTIGRYVSIGEEVQMGRGDHSIAWLSTSPFFYLSRGILDVGRDFEEAEAYHAFRPDTKGTAPFVQGRTIVIENDVWIGHRAYIRPGVRIGTGAIVGAYAVVTRDVPPYAVVVGNPARIARYRFNEALIARLLASKWWTLAPWQLKGIDLSRPAESIDLLERRVAETAPYKPELVHLSKIA